MAVSSPACLIPVFGEDMESEHSAVYLQNDAESAGEIDKGQNSEGIDLLSADLHVPDLYYNGQEQKVNFTVTLDDVLLTEGVDYELSGDLVVKDSTDYIVTITGLGKYSGTYNFGYYVQKADMNDLDISLSKTEFIYTENVIKPVVTVKCGKNVLTRNKDYVLRYCDNVDVGTASIIVKGIGSCCGTVTKEFTILPNSLTSVSSCDVTMAKDTYPYNGLAIKPKVSVRDGKKLLKQGVDYVVRYVNNVNVGTASVVVAGRGDYFGSVTKTYTISDSLKDVSLCDVSLKKRVYTYTGGIIKPKVVIKDGNKVLTVGTDYLLRFVDNIEIGTASVVIAGRGNYTGTVTETFDIVSDVADISNGTVALSSYLAEYTGSPITPEVSVEFDGKTLTQSVDYDVEFSNNIEIGTAKVVVTGKGSYSGTVLKTFEIVDKPDYTDEKIIDIWGNSLTAGNQDGTGVTIATSLQDCLGSDWTVNNYGSGGESSNTVASRQGGVQLKVAESFTIPATATPVNINLTDSTNGVINFRTSIMAAAFGQSVNPCYINGVKGRISHGSVWAQNPYKFTRETAGEEVEVTAGTSVITNAQKEITSSERVIAIWIGENGGWNDDIDMLISMIHSMIDKNNSKRYIVMGMTANGRQDVNSALQKEFGNHFIDSRRYLIDHGLEDAGLTPTEQDKQLIAQDKMPKSLLIEKDNTHFNHYGYTIIGRLMYERGEELGYWK